MMPLNQRILVNYVRRFTDKAYDNISSLTNE
jgi:hypothetical protein